MRKKLTDDFVKKVSVKGRVDFWDTELSSFGLRVSESGAKTWCAIYRFQGLPRRFTIGKYPTFSAKQARVAAAKYLRDAKAGDDPAAEKKVDREAITFGYVTKQYLEKYAAIHKRPSSVYADKCMIEGDLDAWKNRKAANISNRDVAKLLDAIVERGAPIKANRTLALLSKIFRYAIGKGLLDGGTVSPTYLVPRPGKECSRERVLTDAEVKKLWVALGDKPARVAVFFKLALLTGQRAREILEMAKDEVDFEMATWTIPGARTKNKREHLVPLGPQAMNLIESLKNDSAFIFPSRSIAPKPLTEYKTWVDDVRVATGMTKPKGHPQHFTFHDLRRTLTTALTKMGVSQFLADKVTNHKDSSVGAVYNRYEYEAEKRDALTRWDARLAEVVARD